MIFLEDELNDKIIEESFFSFKRFGQNKNDKEKDSLDMEELTKDIRETKEYVENSDAYKVYKDNKKIINFIFSLLKNWIVYGAIIGSAVIPFTLTTILITTCFKKLARCVKEEADKNLLKENIQQSIRLLMNIKSKNSKNAKICNKVDKTIDVLNGIIDKSLSD